MEVVHMALGMATAAEGNTRYPPGEKHGMLVFVKAVDHDEAIRQINMSMNEGCWMLSIDKIGQLPDAVHKPDATDALDIALNEALEDGCGVVVYAEVEE